MTNVPVITSFVFDLSKCFVIVCARSNNSVHTTYYYAFGCATVCGMSMCATIARSKNQYGTHDRHEM